MAGKKTGSDKIEILTRPELLLKINSIPKLRDRALASFIYLSGARIGEILGTKKIYSVYDGKGKNKVKIGVESIPINGLRKENIEVNIDDDVVWVHNVPCLKRKDGKIPRRTIPIIISQEKDFIEIFLQYYNTIEPSENLFKIKRQRAWQIIHKELNIYNHFLIHERCTHLTVQKNFTPLDLMKFRGWSNTMPSSTYAHLNTEDLANKMRGKNVQQR